MSRLGREFDRLRRFAHAARRGRAGASLASFKRRKRESRAYQRLIEKSRITDARRDEMRHAIENFARTPLISVLLPVYNVDAVWLKQCIDSVKNQIYPNWELCVADDASTAGHIRPLLELYAAQDERIRVVFRAENGHISAASNSALELANGEFCVLLDHDDELSEDALFWVASEINEHPQAKMIYSDEDLIDERGRRSEPKFKPDLSRDLLYSLNLVTHLSAYETTLLRSLNGFREGTEGSQDYNLALRVLERISNDEVRHIPKILYHWRSIATSVASGRGAKPYAYERARVAIREHFERLGIAANVVESVDNLNRVHYHAAADRSIAVIRPDARSGSSSSLAAALNDAVRATDAEIICFVDAALEEPSAASIEELTSFLAVAEIGVVGGKVVDEKGRLIDGPLILGGDETVRVAHEGTHEGQAGYFYRAALIGNYSAVSWRAMAVRRADFDAAGGFDAEAFPEALFDADLCLRLGKRGMRTVFTPYALFSGRPIVRQASVAELSSFNERWPEIVRRDPMYSPWFTRCGPTFEIDA